MLSPFVILFVTLLSNTALTAYIESFSAAGLIGSHFGLPNSPATYDYVIVGGGTAGITLARRLAANSSLTVAVIEAGSLSELTNSDYSEIPIQVGQSLNAAPTNPNPLVDWLQYTTPQAGANGRSLFYTQGKTFGGGSTRNAMLYHRASKGAYDKWAATVGDNTYSFQNFLPYLERSVNFTPPTANPRPANATVSFDPSVFSARGGPLHVSYPRWVNAISSWLVLAFRQAGLKEVPSLVTGDILGYSYVPTTIDPDTATRSSSETSFLREAILQTSNLKFYPQTLAKRINFDANKRATSVTVSAGGIQYTISANKEVILSCGSFRSPQLLMVSGVGPASTLSSLNIPVVVDRRGVGQGFWDHVFFGTGYQVNVPTISALSDPAYAGQQAVAYQTNRTGLFTNPTGDLIGYERLPRGSVPRATEADFNSAFSQDWPVIEYLIANAYVWSDLPTTGGNYMSIVAALVAPFSRGNVTIKSNDTADNPIVDPGWLTDKRDQDYALASLKRIRSIMNGSRVKPVIIREAHPGPDVTSDAQLLNTIRNDATTLWHAAASNRMGLANDTMAVVDSKARVIGVPGLRVVDASSLPFLPPGHPQSTIYAYAEKIAADILGGS